ncbi:MAG: alanyl-tRNA editing protein AlaXM [Nitrososphaerota archaeon]|nr:alanyl-tRNA editing protein [Candidatus Geocrenenecus dongiae]
MVELLYLLDCYLKEFEAHVLRISEEGVVLDKTAFYPEGGGQPSDKGLLIHGDEKYEVNYVFKKDDEVYHVVKGAQTLTPGDIVKGVIDWDRRYTYMRYHTALHVLSGVVYNLYGSVVTGSQISEDKARIDFTLEDLSKEKVQVIEDKANEIVQEARAVKIKFIPREELLRNPSLIRIKPELIPNIPILRVVEIEGFDAQIDGGTHVSNTREIGRIRIIKTINKGRFNKRIEIKLE